MNFGLVARVLGNLLLIEGAVLTIPLGMSWYCRERSAVLGFLLSMGIMGLLGLFLSNIPVKSQRLKARKPSPLLPWAGLSFPFRRCPWCCPACSILC